MNFKLILICDTEPGPVGNRPVPTCGDSTAKQAGLVNGKIRGNLHHIGHINHRVLGEARDVYEMVQDLPLQVPESAGSVPRHVMDQPLVTQ